MEHTDNTRQIIAEVLGVENSAAWKIVSSDPDHNLYMVHHVPEAAHGKYAGIRGVVVDTQARTIICKSYGYTPTTIMDKLSVQSDGMIRITDDLGLEHLVDPARMQIKSGFEGTLIHVFKHDGIVYRATRKRLDPENSRWGNSKSFLEMYWELGGPKDEDLFNPETNYSPYCHVFIMVHPDVLVVSKENIGDGYMVYLGPQEMWSVEYDECPYKQVREDGTLFEGVSQEEFDADTRPNAGWIDSDLRMPTTVSHFEPGATRDITILSPPNLSLEQANHHLTFGYYSSFPGWQNYDRRLLPGEFVIVHFFDENGNLEEMIKVESTSYAWRATMRDNNPNLLHRFYQLLNGSYIRYETPEGREKYLDLYPILTPYPLEIIKQSLPLVVWPEDPTYYDPNMLTNRDSRLYNIWMAFMMAVPLHRQFEVAGFFTQLINTRNQVIGWLRKIESFGKLDSSEYNKRVINIIEAARRFSGRKIEQGQDRDYTGRKKSFKELTRDNIRNLVMKEEGSSLYRLAKEMKRWHQEQQEQREQQKEQ